VAWHPFLTDPVAASAVAGCVALILFSAAWHKFSELDVFAGALDAYQLLPSAWVMPIARVLPFVEAAIGVGVLIPATRASGLIVFATLMAVYGIAIAINLVRGRHQIDCGCGGDVHLLSWGLVVRNGLLVCVALAMSAPSLGRPYEWLDAVTLIVGVLALYGSYLTFDELLRQFGRIAQLKGKPSGAAS
jgi:Methylamine utilisation protein MauE